MEQLRRAFTLPTIFRISSYTLQEACQDPVSQIAIPHSRRIRTIFSAEFLLLTELQVGMTRTQVQEDMRTPLLYVLQGVGHGETTFSVLGHKHQASPNWNKKSN